MTTTANPESVLFISYDRPKAGRELSALETITTLSSLLAKKQAEGTIHSVDAVSLTPAGGCVGGFILVRGDQSAIEELRLSEDLTDLMLRGHLFMDVFSVVDGVTGERQKSWLGHMANLFVRKDGMDVIK
jgi:hypothetical protein